MKTIGGASAVELTKAGTTQTNTSTISPKTSKATQLIKTLASKLIGNTRGDDDDTSVPDFKRTKMTGIRSAGFFPSTAAVSNSLEGTFKYKPTIHGKDEFPARNILKTIVDVDNLQLR